MRGAANAAQIGTNGGTDPDNVDYTLFNQVTIQGFGLIGSNVGSLYSALSLNNSGTVDSNSSGNTLTIAGTGVITNTGLLEATGGGILAITATNPVNNLNGNITANGSGSTVEFSNAIQGGTLNTLNGGVMETVGTLSLIHISPPVTRLGAPLGIGLSQMSGCVPAAPADANASHFPSRESAGSIAFGMPGSKGMSW